MIVAMRWIAILLVLVLAVPSFAEKREPTTKMSDVLKSKYIRPGWRLVDGGWTKPQAKLALSELVQLVDERGVHRLIAQPGSRVEPMLTNWRTSVVEIDQSDYAWKLSCTGRVWDDRKADGTQHLQLIAATDDALADMTIRLTKIEITPGQSAVQAAVVEPDGSATSILVVFSRDFTELALAPLGESKTNRIARASSAREMLREQPADARTYLVPVMRLLAGHANVLQPAAGDVYRVFPDLPVEPRYVETIQKLLPDLADRDPAIRQRASRELASLGRRGVQAAMRIDPETLAPEASDRIKAFIQSNTHDTRAPAALVADDSFLVDCLADPDQAVRNRAQQLLKPSGVVP